MAMPYTAGASFSQSFSSPELVARDAERQVLLDTIVRAPAVVFVEGEAGIGKTRLVAEIDTAGRDRRRVLTGHCHPQGLPFPLEPVVEALLHLGSDLDDMALPPMVGALRPLLPELAPHLPPLPEALGDRRSEAHQLFRAIRELLTALGPAVIVLEDLHWADEGTIELLQFLVGDLPPRLCLVLTYRSEDLTETSPLRGLAARVRGNVAHARIVLSPLATADIASLTGAIVGADSVEEKLAGYLHDRTEGVPYAIEEVLRLLHERDHLVLDGRCLRAGDLGRGDVPGAIRDAVIERVGRLAADTRQLVRAAAVFAQPTSERTLRALADLNEEVTVTALSEALQSFLLHEDEWAKASFRHDLAAQAVYESIPPPQRRALHAKAAEVLEADRSGTAVRLAYHYREAGSVDAWVEHAERAADQALALFDEPSACRILQEVLATPAISASVRAHLARKLGLAANLGLAQRQAVEILGEVIRDCSLPSVVQGELRLLVGMAMIGMGETAAGSQELRRCIDELGPNKMLSALAMVYLAYPTLSDDPLSVHLQWLERAGEMIESIPNAQVRRNMYRSVGRDRSAILVQVGDPTGPDAVGEVPQPLGSERRQAASWYTSLARGAADVGHGERAGDFLSRCQAVLADLDYPQMRAAVAGTVLLLDWYEGRWDELEERARGLIDDPDEGPAKIVLSHLVSALAADACTASDDTEDRLRVAMERAQRVGWIAAFCTAAGTLARYYLRSNQRQAASDVAGQAVGAMRVKQIWVWAGAAVPTAVEASVVMGRVEEAEALVDEVEAGLTGTDAPAAQAALVLCRGMLAEAGDRHHEAAVAFDAAAARYSALPRPYDAALATERAARALTASGAASAGERVAAAFDAFDKLGARGDATRLRSFTRRHGMAMPERNPPGRPSFGSELSPREIEVLQMAADGKTSGDIARELVLSRRTVENHLAKARRKQQAAEYSPE